MTLVFTRTIFMFAIIILALRIMGKKQLGELQPSELVSTIIISSLATIAIESTELPIWTSVIPIFVIVAFEILLSAISVKSTKAAQILSGNPKIIIKNGVIDQKMLLALRYTAEDLLETLRTKDIFELDEVDFAMVETSGKISVRKKSDITVEKNSSANNSTNKKLATIPPLPVVIDGTFCHTNMAYCGIDESYILYYCTANNCNLKDVLLLMCDDTKKTTLVKKENFSN